MPHCVMTVLTAEYSVRSNRAAGMIVSVITDEQAAENCLEARVFTRVGVGLDIDEARRTYCALGMAEAQLNAAAADYQRFLSEVASAGTTVGVAPPLIVPIMSYPWRKVMLDLSGTVNALDVNAAYRLRQLIARSNATVNALSRGLAPRTVAPMGPVEVPLLVLAANTVPGAF